jgi:hypothetical protein
MEKLRDISELIGIEDQSADICQTYLDQPLTFGNDNLDLFVSNIKPDVLDNIIRKIKECDSDELSGQLRRHLYGRSQFVFFKQNAPTMIQQFVKQWATLQLNHRMDVSLNGI